MASRTIASPIGDLILIASEHGLSGVGWIADVVADPGGDWHSAEAHLDQAELELGEYFAGSRSNFGVTLDRRTRVGFRGEVLDVLETVPFGTTVSYAQLAQMAGRLRAARAVGSAMATNPIAILVPCHRVLPAGGGPGRYAGGTTAKELLLRIESDNLQSEGGGPMTMQPL
jgi:methylated-DNA-[protein]-cysteine S-methyltransferase